MSEPACIEVQQSWLSLEVDVLVKASHKLPYTMFHVLLSCLFVNTYDTASGGRRRKAVGKVAMSTNVLANSVCPVSFEVFAFLFFVPVACWRSAACKGSGTSRPLSFRKIGFDLLLIVAVT